MKRILKSLIVSLLITCFLFIAYQIVAEADNEDIDLLSVLSSSKTDSDSERKPNLRPKFKIRNSLNYRNSPQKYGEKYDSVDVASVQSFRTGNSSVLQSFADNENNDEQIQKSTQSTTVKSQNINIELNDTLATTDSEIKHLSSSTSSGLAGRLLHTLTTASMSKRQYVVQHSNSCLSSLFTTDERFVHNCITNDMIGSIPVDVVSSPLSRIYLKRYSSESNLDRKSSFRKVFETTAWGHGWDPYNISGLSISGMGATILWSQEVTATLHLVITQLKHHLKKSHIKLLDVPCGDMAWMSRFLKTRDDIDYTGIDILPEIISRHRATFRDKPWRFIRQDILTNRLDEQFDLILCRTLLQHLFDNDALRLLSIFSSSGSRYLLTTSFSQHQKNTELNINDDNPGRFRKLNLEIPPFSLTAPLCLVRDGPPDAFEGWEHFLGLWRLPLSQVTNCSQTFMFTFGDSGKKISSCTNWGPNG